MTGNSILTQPNMYARGILFGKMKYELGDHSIVRCPELGLVADIEFKTKGYFSGTYNAIGGTIKIENTGEILYELSGMWNAEMYIRDVATGKKDLLFNALKTKATPPLLRSLEEQTERESQKLWYRTAQAVIARNHEVATEEKTAIEDMQREEAAKRVADGVEWHPRYFRRVRGGPGGSEEGDEDLNWILNADMYVWNFLLDHRCLILIEYSDGPTPADQVRQILAITPIVRGQQHHERMPIPPPRHSRQSLESIRSGKSIKWNANSHLYVETPHPPPVPPIPHPNENDLIDFTQHNEPSAAQLTPVPVPADLLAAQMENDRRAQKELELTLAKTSTSNEKSLAESGALHNFHKDLSISLPPTPASPTPAPPTPASPVVRRTDSDTKSVDEFVDAQG